jgi:dephospho-CoA kinase
MVIGLTGGIGSGKTTVLRFFEELGAKVFIADVEAKALMNTDKDLIKDIKNLLGEEAYLNGELNRKYVATKVFEDSKKIALLNALVHPKVRNRFINFKEKDISSLIIYEAAILFESGSDTLCDYIITVVSDLKTKVKRIIARDGISEQEILSRMKHQYDDDFKIKKSNFVIQNNNLKYTRSQVNTIYNILNNLKK